jgi:hypothetical protein
LGWGSLIYNGKPGKGVYDIEGAVKRRDSVAVFEDCFVINEIKP